MNLRSNHRVVVTGMGVITPLGIGKMTFWEAIVAGQIGVAPVTRFDASACASRLAAQIDGFDPADHMDARRVRRTDRYAQFAIAATRLALADAEFCAHGNGHDVGVYVGSALGGLAFAEAQHGQFMAGGVGTIRPLLAISVFGGASSSNIALEFDLSGPNVSNGNSCAAGAVAIGEGFRAVARGDVRAAVAGGVEAPLAPLSFAAFSVINAMSKRNDDPPGASRPFDRARDGFVMAEGAGIIVLERRDDAISRGARIYGEVAGYGLSNDAHHMTAPRPDGEGATRAMTAALREASLTPAEVELINAHGSATPLGDRAESVAIKRVFGDGAGRIPIMATKGQHAHALGATGAWEAALALLAMQARRVPPIVNLEHAEDDLDYVRAFRDLAPRVTLANSFGFGGINAALVLRTE